VLLAVGWAVAARASGRSMGRTARTILLAGGVAVAAAPAAVTTHLHLSGEPVIAGWLAGLLLIAGTVAATVVGARRPVAAMATAIVGTLAFEAVLFGAFMPALTRESLAPRAGRRASEMVRPDEHVVVFKPRDDEIFFYLPLGSGRCGGAGCLANLHRDGEAMLGLSRVPDFELLRDEWPDVDLEEVARVEGLDLSRGVRAEVVIFRPGRSDGGPSGTGRNVDRQQAPS
jgi:hypothetical protein